MTPENRRKDLADALHAVAEAQRAEAAETQRRQQPPRRTGTQPATIFIGILAACVLGWLWTARPAAIFAPELTAPLTPAAAEARSRFALYLERARVDAYRRSVGRLPSSLEQAGPVEDSVTFRITDGGYVLERRASGALMQLTDQMNSDSFLGTAAVAPPRKPQ
ncbi:MAG: hypothetical protein IPP98_02500 [Gemmatimonadetes bacterium]|nr:hypothetical protein [Gemmatimonadota bacterium]